MSFTAPKFTNAGKALLSRALSGDCAVKFTSLALGSGELSSQAIAAMTGLIAEQKRVGLEVYQRIDAETVNVRGTFNNSELAAGFHWREVGLFAQNPDDPDNRAADILYCYQNAGDLAEYIPSVDSEVMEKTISLTTKISDAAEVTAILLSEVYASKEDFEEVASTYVKTVNDQPRDKAGNVFIESDFFAETSRINIFTSEADDTVENWIKRRGGVYYFTRTGQLVNQPGTHGLVTHFVQHSNVFQFWHTQPKGGDVYFRSMNTTAGRIEWTRLAVGSEVVKKVGDMMTGTLDMSHNDLINVGRMEMIPPVGEVHGGYIDFHFSGKDGDFTSRIMEDAEGHMQINAPSGTQFMGPIGSSAENAFQVSRSFGDIWSVITSAQQFGFNLYYGIASSGYRGIYDGHKQKWLVAYSEKDVAIIDGAFAVKTMNGVGAGESGDISDFASKGGDYVRFTNGLQICWGGGQFGNNIASATVTMPAAFKSVNSYVIVPVYHTTTPEIVMSVAKIDAASATLYRTNYSSGGVFSWIAIGLWK